MIKYILQHNIRNFIYLVWIQMYFNIIWCLQRFPVIRLGPCDSYTTKPKYIPETPTQPILPFTYLININK